MLENDYFCFSMKVIDHSNPLVVHNKNKFKSLLNSHETKFYAIK